MKPTKLAARARPESFAYFAVSRPTKKQLLIWENRPSPKPAGQGGRCLCVCVCAFSLCMYCIIYLMCVGMFVHVYTCVCVQTCDRMNVNLTACSYYPTFVKQTNSLKPNAEHSSALESASYVGGWNCYRDISGFDSRQQSDRPRNEHQRGPLFLSLPYRAVLMRPIASREGPQVQVGLWSVLSQQDRQEGR